MRRQIPEFPREGRLPSSSSILWFPFGDRRTAFCMCCHLPLVILRDWKRQMNSIRGDVGTWRRLSHMKKWSVDPPSRFALPALCQMDRWKKKNRRGLWRLVIAWCRWNLCTWEGSEDYGDVINGPNCREECCGVSLVNNFACCRMYLLTWKYICERELWRHFMLNPVFSSAVQNTILLRSKQRYGSGKGSHIFVVIH